MDEQVTNKTHILIVDNDGTWATHPQLSQGMLLQILDNIRATVLAMPVMRNAPTNGKHAAPQPTPEPIEA